MPVSRSLICWAAAALLACVILPSTTHAQVRFSGGSGVPVSIEVLEDITATLKPGASFRADRIFMTVPNALVSNNFNWYNLIPSPSPGFTYQLTSSSPIQSVSGLDTHDAGSNFYTSFHPTHYSHWYFSDGGSFTFKAGITTLPVDIVSTALIVSNPGQIYTITADSFSSAGEFGPPLSPSMLTVTPVPGPSSVPEIDPNSFGSAIALVAGSIAMLERRFRRKALIAA